MLSSDTNESQKIRPTTCNDCGGEPAIGRVYNSGLGLKPGDVVNGEIQSGKQIYVLPAGDWQVVARTLVQGADAHNAPFPIMNVMFAQIDHLRLVGLVRLIATQTDVPTSRGWKDDPCPPSMKETYFRNTFGSGYNFPECVYARPVLGFGSSGPYWGDVVRRVQESGVEFPPAMVYVDYQYFSGQGFVKLSAWLNPDIAGIDQDKTRLLLDSPWASGNLSGDKKVFVASVRRWSEAMAYAVHRSYTGETVAIPALPNRPAVQ